MGGYADTKAFSNKKLVELRKTLAPLVPSEELVVTCGSYARREAVEDSDLDFFSVSPRPLDDDRPLWFGSLEDTVKEIVGKLPSRDGAFSEVVARGELLTNYGGSDDTNASITRRMLYLLEGEFLTNQTEFNSLRQEILARYVGNTPSDHQLAFYLVNDIIRYWRTIAVDYADKTYGAPTVTPRRLVTSAAITAIWYVITVTVY